MSKSHSRRAILAGIAAAPVLAAPALALSSAGPDPIFALIERHKACNAAFSSVLREPGQDRDEWRRREDEASDVERDACGEMVATVPTTLAGLLALLRYVEHEHARGETLLDESELEELLSAAVSALERIGGVS